MRLLILIACLGLAGCFGRDNPAQNSPAESPADGQLRDELAEVTTLEEARQVSANLAARAKAAEVKVQELEKQRDAERLAKLQTSAYWAAGVLMFVAILCVAAAIFFSAARKLLLTGAAGAIGGMVVAITVAELLPYAKWFGIIGGGLGLIGLLVYLWRLKTLNQETVQVGVEALYRLGARNTADAESVKLIAQARQLEKGIHDDIHRLIAPVKKKNGYHQPSPEPAT